MDTIAKRVKHLRELDGITQVQLAEYLKIAPFSLQRIEYGKANPSLNTINNIANFFNVPTDYLLGNGLFADWDVIMDNIDQVTKKMDDEHPIAKLYAIEGRNEKELMLILPSFVKSVKIVDGKLEITYLNMP